VPCLKLINFKIAFSEPVELRRYGDGL
jgi:hypothetical protein